MNLKRFIFSMKMYKFFLTRTLEYSIFIDIFHSIYKKLIYRQKMAEMQLAMIKLREKGLSIRKILKLLDIPVMTILSDHIRRYEGTGRHENKPKGRPEKSSRNRRNI